MPRGRHSRPALFSLSMFPQSVDGNQDDAEDRPKSYNEPRNSIPPKPLPVWRMPQPHAQENRLSTIPSSANLNKELPALPSPAITDTSSIPYSSIPGLAYASSAPQHGSLPVPGALERPDSSTLPLTAANPDFFLPAPEDFDEFFPPEQTYAAQRRNAVHDRVKKWAEDPSLNTVTSNSGAQFLFANEEDEEDDDGEVLSPAFRSPIWEYPTRGNVNAQTLQYSELQPGHHSVRPILEFSTIAALVEAPAKRHRPAHISIPLSVGYSDLPSSAGTTSPVRERPNVPNSAPPQLNQRVPLQLASPPPSKGPQRAHVFKNARSLSPVAEHRKVIDDDHPDPTYRVRNLNSAAAPQNVRAFLVTPPPSDVGHRKERDGHPRHTITPTLPPSTNRDSIRHLHALPSSPVSSMEGQIIQHAVPDSETSASLSLPSESILLSLNGLSGAESVSSIMLSREGVASGEIILDTRPDSIGTFGQSRSPTCFPRCSSAESISDSESLVKRSPVIDRNTEWELQASSPTSVHSFRRRPRSPSPVKRSPSQSRAILAQGPSSPIVAQPLSGDSSLHRDPQSPLSVLKFADIRSSLVSMLTLRPRRRVVTVNTVPRSSEIPITPVTAHQDQTSPADWDAQHTRLAKCIMTPIVEGRSSLSSNLSTAGDDVDSDQDSLPELPTKEDSLSVGTDVSAQSKPTPSGQEAIVLAKSTPTLQRALTYPATHTSTWTRPDVRSPPAHLEDIVLQIQTLSEQSVEGIISMIAFFSSCKVLADRHGIIKLCISARDSIEAVTRIVEAGPTRAQDLVYATLGWRHTFHERLCSLHQNLAHMAEFSEGLVRRPPRLHKVHNTLEKLQAYIAKFNNLSIKLNSSLERLQKLKARADLVGARRTVKKNQHHERALQVEAAYRALCGQRNGSPGAIWVEEAVPKMLS